MEYAMNIIAIISICMDIINLFFDFYGSRPKNICSADKQLDLVCCSADSDNVALHRGVVSLQYDIVNGSEGV